MPPTRTSESSSKAQRHNPTSKSNRLQNSACAPCRQRRVKCDRKDAPIDGSAPAVCTECYQRSFNCVDDIKQAKPPKLLRRGRKIQELEQLYGNPEVYDVPSPERNALPSRSSIPELTMEFFKSKFYKRFHVQRPVVDPQEFTERYRQYLEDGVPLGNCGELIAKILATWAASYGVDENGVEQPHGGFAAVDRRRETTNTMVKELLQLVDKYALLRTVSWDGVRVLLLLLPLTEEVQPPMERSAMYHSTIYQVYQLAKAGDIPSSNVGDEKIGHLVRAKIFWYGHVHEGLTSGLRGGKMVFDQGDVDAFRTPLTTGDYNHSLSRSNVTSSYTYRHATAPIRLSAACRLVNTVLTGPAAQRSETVDRAGMDQVWRAIEESWEEFEELRDGPNSEGRMSSNDDSDRFASGWQIFIFEVYSIIREKLGERINRLQGSRSSGGALSLDPHPMSSAPAALLDLEQLYGVAECKCNDLAPKVMGLVRRHIDTGFFEYDASLVRDGVFYLGKQLASDPSSNEDVSECLRVFEKMRWGFSKGQERTQRLRALWDLKMKQEDFGGGPSGTGPSRSRPKMMNLSMDALGRVANGPVSAPGSSFPRAPLAYPSMHHSKTNSVDGKSVRVKQSSSPTGSHFSFHGAPSASMAINSGSLTGSPASSTSSRLAFGNGMSMGSHQSPISYPHHIQHPQGPSHQPSSSSHLYDLDSLNDYGFNHGSADNHDFPSSSLHLLPNPSPGYRAVSLRLPSLPPPPSLHQLPSLSPSSGSAYSSHISPVAATFPPGVGPSSDAAAYDLPRIQSTSTVASSAHCGPTASGYFDTNAGSSEHHHLPPLHYGDHYNARHPVASDVSSGAYYDALEGTTSSSVYLPSISTFGPYSSSSGLGNDILNDFVVESLTNGVAPGSMGGVPRHSLTVSTTTMNMHPTTSAHSAAGTSSSASTPALTSTAETYSSAYAYNS